MAWRFTIDDVGTDLDNAVSNATIRAMRFLMPNVQIVSDEDLGVEGRDWFIEDVTAVLSPGGTTVGVAVDFAKCGTLANA